MTRQTTRESATASRAAVLSILLAVAILLAFAGRAPARANEEPCSAYPTPGTLAPAGAHVSPAVIDRFGILRRPQRAVDRLRAGQISGSLTASRLILSGTRFLGHTAFGGRVYLVPAEHLLAFPIAPRRCLSAEERSVEHDLLPQLRREYAHPALCLLIIHVTSSGPSCGSAFSTSEALLETSGTPGFGLVPDDVSNVTVLYANAPPRTLVVRHNFFAVISPKGAFAAPCGLQWLDPTGTVLRTVTGCSFITAETQALDEYRLYVTRTLVTLRWQVDALITAIRSGSLATAEAAWLPAHMTWMELGQDDGPYGCFGELGRQIDGTAAGLVDGTASPHFTGFHRIELDLWTNRNLRTAATDTAQLQSFVNELVSIPLASELPATRLGIGNWALRPHEIIEDADRDTLTGDDDYGSGTGLASLSADIAADREFLSVLAQVIGPQAPGLVGRANRELDTLSAAIRATRVNDGWVAVANLPPAEREQIDADTGTALGTLAPIPDLITSTGNNAPPT